MSSRPIFISLILYLNQHFTPRSVKAQNRETVREITKQTAPHERIARWHSGECRTPCKWCFFTKEGVRATGTALHLIADERVDASTPTINLEVITFSRSRSNDLVASHTLSQVRYLFFTFYLSDTPIVISVKFLFVISRHSQSEKSWE